MGLIIQKSVEEPYTPELRNKKDNYISNLYDF